MNTIKNINNRGGVFSFYFLIYSAPISRNDLVYLYKSIRRHILWFFSWIFFFFKFLCLCYGVFFFNCVYATYLVSWVCVVTACECESPVSEQRKWDRQTERAMQWCRRRISWLVLVLLSAAACKVPARLLLLKMNTATATRATKVTSLFLFSTQHALIALYIGLGATKPFNLHIETFIHFSPTPGYSPETEISQFFTKRILTKNLQNSL